MCWHGCAHSPTWNVSEKPCALSWMIWPPSRLIGWSSRSAWTGLSACRHRVENYRLPKAESQRTALAQQIGADGLHLLQALEQPAVPAEFKEVTSVQLLQQVWTPYYDLSGGKAKWRAGPQAREDEGLIRSP